MFLRLPSIMETPVLVVVVVAVVLHVGMCFEDICSPGVNCRLPDARIKSLELREIPQLVLITFDGVLAPAISQKLFNANRRNPDGCPISMTTFANTSSVDIREAYAEIQRGMEVSLLGNIDFSNSTEKEAYNMILRVKTEMASKIPHLQKVLGWRSSEVSLAGRKLFNALSYIGFTYDATLMVNKPPDGKSFQWPFRLSRGWALPPCDQRGNCNMGHFPNLMQFPMTALFSYYHNVNCFTVRNCSGLRSGESIKDLLLRNLNQFRNGNRAPFLVQIDSAWLQTKQLFVDNLDAFLERLSELNDIYIVSIEKAVKWLHNPHPVSSLRQFRDWQCPLQASSLSEPFKRYPKRPSDPYRPRASAQTPAAERPLPKSQQNPLFSWNSKTRVEKVNYLYSRNNSGITIRPMLSLLVISMSLLKLCRLFIFRV